MDINLKRRSTLLRHIKNVQDNCQILAEKLIERGEENLAHAIIANSFIHDNSKFYGIEWLYLHEDVKISEPELFKAAAYHHTHTNKHHPEYWSDGIHGMPTIFLLEMVADWSARSSEFGSDCLSYVKDTATEKYKFSTSGRVYKQIKEYLTMIFEKPFK